MSIEDVGRMAIMADPQGAVSAIFKESRRSTNSGMDNLYGKAVALAVPVFLFLIALELIVDRARHTRCYNLADSINSLSCGIVSTGVRVFFGFLGIFFYQWICRHWAPVRLPAGNWGVWIFAFVFYDFCYYWNHRWGHTVGLFWASHVVHHQSEEFNLTTALRQTGTGAFTNWIFYLPMALVGVPLVVYLMVGVVAALLSILAAHAA